MIKTIYILIFVLYENTYRNSYLNVPNYKFILKNYYIDNIHRLTVKEFY